MRLMVLLVSLEVVYFAQRTQMTNPETSTGLAEEIILREVLLSKNGKKVDIVHTCVCVGVNSSSLI